METIGEQPQMKSLNQAPDLEQFEDINLTDEEAKEVLRAARQRKHYAQRENQYWDQVNSGPVQRKYTAQEVLDAYKEHYTIDGENEKVVTDLAYYFTDDQRFSGNLKKGILLHGNVGVGKTALMDFFVRNPKQSFILVSCRQIEKDFATHDPKEGDGIGKYSLDWISRSSTADPFGHKSLGFCFDDLGTEPAVTKFFGTDKSVMTEVILNRYDNKLEFFKTHITTNLDDKKIESRYGTRAWDRIKQMFNIIEFKTIKSRRA